MGKGNANKTKQARERAAEKKKKSAPTSQSKSNEKARTIICEICRNAFLMTTKAPELELHSQNKHSKTMAECFPSFTG